MQCDEDCRTAGFGKTERPVGWEGDGELSRVKLVRHCERGKPAGTDRLHLQALSHSFTLDWVVTAGAEEGAKRALDFAARKLADLGLSLNPEKTRIIRFEHGLEFLGYKFDLFLLTATPPPASTQRLVRAVRAVNVTLGGSAAEFCDRTVPAISGIGKRAFDKSRDGVSRVAEFIRRRVKNRE